MSIIAGVAGCVLALLVVLPVAHVCIEWWGCVLELWWPAKKPILVEEQSCPKPESGK